MVAALIFTLTQVSPTVAILPTINRTPEENDQVRRDMTESVSGFLRKAFKANGFQVVESQAVEAALKDTGIDLEDEELHRRETFLKIGEAVKADYVYFSTIETTGFFSANTGKAVIRVWFLDVKGKGASSRQGPFKAKLGRGSGAVQNLRKSRLRVGPPNKA